MIVPDRRAVRFNRYLFNVIAAGNRFIFSTVAAGSFVLFALSIAYRGDLMETGSAIENGRLTVRAEVDFEPWTNAEPTRLERVQRFFGVTHERSTATFTLAKKGDAVCRSPSANTSWSSNCSGTGSRCSSRPCSG